MTQEIKLNEKMPINKDKNQDKKIKAKQQNCDRKIEYNIFDWKMYSLWMRRSDMSADMSKENKTIEKAIYDTFPNYGKS